MSEAKRCEICGRLFRLCGYGEVEDQCGVCSPIPVIKKTVAGAVQPEPPAPKVEAAVKPKRKKAKARKKRT